MLDIDAMGDEELGRNVRQTAERLALALNDASAWAVYARALIIGAINIGSTDTDIDQTGVKRSGVDVGDWTVSIRQTRAPRREGE